MPLCTQIGTAKWAGVYFLSSVYGSGLFSVPKTLDFSELLKLHHSGTFSALYKDQQRIGAMPKGRGFPSLPLPHVQGAVYPLTASLSIASSLAH